MKFRIVALVAATGTLCFATASSAVALPYHHKPAPPQITGSRMVTALLPAADFGGGFVFEVSENTGKKLLVTKHPVHVSSLSCYDFYNTQITGGVGNTAGAASRYDNPAPSNSGYPATILRGAQDVVQFASNATANSYFGQEEAKYAACTTFVIPNPGSNPYLVSLVRITKTSVNGNPAFWVASAAGGGLAYVDVLCVVAGTNVYTFWQLAASENEPPGTLMTSLIHRVQALYPRHK